MSDAQQNIEINVEQEFDRIDYAHAEIQQLVKGVSARFSLKTGAINIIIVGDEKITQVNKQFLNADRTTDVISFDLSDDKCPAAVFDIFVNGEMAIRQAQKRGHDNKAELALYIVHGLLHNLGFDDTTEADAAAMHEMEDKILTEHGFGNVYSSKA